MENISFWKREIDSNVYDDACIIRVLEKYEFRQKFLYILKDTGLFDSYPLSDIDCVDLSKLYRVPRITSPDQFIITFRLPITDGGAIFASIDTDNDKVKVAINYIGSEENYSKDKLQGLRVLLSVFQIVVSNLEMDKEELLLLYKLQ